MPAVTTIVGAAACSDLVGKPTTKTRSPRRAVAPFGIVVVSGPPWGSGTRCSTATSASTPR